MFKLCDLIVEYLYLQQKLILETWMTDGKCFTHKNSKHDQAQMFSSQFVLQTLIKTLNNAEIICAGYSGSFQWI